MFQKEFPATPRLSFTFIWDKTDAYGQKVYGLAEAVGESLKRLYFTTNHFISQTGFCPEAESVM